MKKTVNQKLRDEALKAVVEIPDLTYAQIGEILGVSGALIGVWVHSAGITRRQRKAKQLTETVDVDAQILWLEKQLDEATDIHFERDGNDVVVYGLGPEPVVANVKDWVRFLRHNGGAMLREFIGDEFGNNDVDVRMQ